VRLKRLWQRARHFLSVGIWATSLEDAPWGRRLVYRLCRTVYATVRGIVDKQLTVRAASLTYYSVLSVVPFLAFAFSILKGFGVYGRLMRDSVRPALEHTFAGNKSLLQAIDQMLVFVEHTNVSGLSIVGVLLLGYTSISMLSSVETTFNSIWEVRRPRRPLRKVTDYTTMMVVGPLLIMGAIAFSTAAQNSRVIEELRHSWLSGIVNFTFGLTSLVLVTCALIALYGIMPNARTHFASVLVGGVVAGLLWQGLLVLHVKFQVGVAKYNALYSGFAALPIFLVWLDLSWIIVLVGAQLAASHQYERRFKNQVRAQHVDQELKESLAVAVAAAVGRRFIEGRPPVTALELAEALEAPPPAVEQVLDALVRAGLLVRVAEAGEPGYDPARDVDTVHVAELEGAVRYDPSAAALKEALEHAVGAELGALLRSRHAEPTKDLGAVTLREIALQSDVRIDGFSRPGAKAAGAAPAPAGNKKGAPS
jgi:membrane protein